MKINLINKTCQPYSRLKSRAMKFLSVMAFQFCVRAISFRWVCHKMILNIVSSVTNYILSFRVLIMNHPCSDTNNKCKANVTCHSLSKILDIMDLQYCNYCHLLSGFSSNLNHP